MTVEEFLQNHLQISHFYDVKTNQMVCYSDEVQQAMIEYAKLKVTEALKAASENASIIEEDSLFGGTNYLISEESILSAYPLDLIK